MNKLSLFQILSDPLGQEIEIKMYDLRFTEYVTLADLAKISRPQASDQYSNTNPENKVQSESLLKFRY